MAFLVLKAAVKKANVSGPVKPAVNSILLEIGQVNPDVNAHGRAILNPRRSTHRVTSPFLGSLPPATLHIHRSADFPDVYVDTLLVNRPYDAILDVFLALPPVPAELHALRLLLACSGRRF